jgi:hypothetical protein
MRRSDYKKGGIFILLCCPFIEMAIRADACTGKE